jgi:transposase-like protein
MGIARHAPAPVPGAAEAPSSMVDLPPANTKRWVVRRKAAVLAAVRSGAITIEEACRRYDLSEEEFLSWQRAFDTHGLPGLRATRLPASRGRRRNPRRSDR